MEKWCLDTVRWSKTGIFCCLYISVYLHEVIPVMVHCNKIRISKWNSYLLLLLSLCMMAVISLS